MTQTSLSPVVRHIRRLVAADLGRELSDTELLQRFAADREERAFAALFRRHGPLVWSICYSVLHHRQDTEDAFQATFLLLARRAGSIRKTEAVASWLYRVAHRVATKAGQNMARRRFQERQGDQRQVSPPEAEAAWRELQALLNEEVQRLPEKYRAPFILCCLEGKTGPEAARQLGWKVGTVTGRLTEARKLLQRRLGRRGVALSSVLAAATVAQAGAATACAALAEGTVKAALAFTTQAATAGLVSAKAAALVEAVAKQLAVTKLKVATALLLGGALLTAGAGALMHTALAAKETPTAASQPQQPRAKKEVRERSESSKPGAEGKDSIRYSGRVLGPDGKSVTGAKLYVTLAYGYAHRPEQSPLYGTTGADGRFKFAVPRAKYLDMPTFVGVMAANYGAGWVMVPADGKREDLALQVVTDDVPITGHIVDLEGKPVSGATLRVLQINAAPGEDLGQWLEAANAKKGLSLELEQQYLKQYTIAVSAQAKTDGEGRFRLTGIGRNRLVRVQLDGPTIASQQLCILTRPGNAIEVTEFEGKPEYNDPRRVTTYFGANFRYVAAPTKPIIGVLRDKDTKKPLAGVTIQSFKLANNPIHGMDIVQTTTDAQGRYRLTGMPKGKDNKIRLMPRDDQPYVSVHALVPDSPGLDPVTVDFELKRGVWIEGKVTDKVTGKPLKASVEYFSMESNPNLGDYPGFSGTFHNIIAGKEDGSYRVVGLPGPGLIGVYYQKDHYMRAGERDDEYAAKYTQETPLNTAPYVLFFPNNFNAVARIEPGKELDSVKQDVTIDPGWTFTGRLLGPDDKPLEGVGRFGTGVWDDPEKRPAEFTVRAFNPRRPRDIFFQHLEKGLVGMAQPPKENGGSIIVRMDSGAAVTGRLVDAHGQPRAGVELELTFRIKGPGWSHFPPERIKTDREGRFRIGALLPKYDYRLSDHKGELLVGEGLRLGQRKDLGDVRIKERKE
jgi:RNA polymerase sigma factor (sigma-70 family)